MYNVIKENRIIVDDLETKFTPIRFDFIFNKEQSDSTKDSELGEKHFFEKTTGCFYYCLTHHKKDNLYSLVRLPVGVYRPVMPLYYGKIHSIGHATIIFDGVGMFDNIDNNENLK